MKNTIINLASQPTTILTFLLLLIIYWRLAARSAKLPKIPLGLFILYLFSELGRVLLGWTGFQDWSDILDLAGDIAFYCAIANLFYYIVFDLWLAKRRGTPSPKITRDVILAVMFIIISFTILHRKGGINLASLLTTSAVLTMVIGLALQDTLGNLISGLALQTEKPFQIGEWISFREHIGEVAGVTWKSTLIRTPEHEIVYVPNNVISKEIVKNYSRPEPKHIACIEIGVQYEIPPNKVREIIINTLNGHPKVLKEPQPQIRLLSFGDSSITYQIRLWNEDFENEKTLKSDLMTMLWYALKRNKINIPFPIRDIRMHHITSSEARKSLEKTTSDIKKEFRSIPILEPLGDDDIEILSSRVSLELFGDGETIVNAGDPGDSMYIIHEGSCDVVIKPSNETVASLHKGNFFGEMSLLTGEKRTATVIASGDTSVFKIDKDSFADIMKAHPAISEKLGRALVIRQTALAKLKNKKEEEPTASLTDQMISKIKDFFGIG